MNRNVLCVDDEESILKGMHLHLSREFNLSTTTSADEGLKIFGEKGPFAVVVGDMRMPGMDGAEMLKQMKDIDPKVKSILLTGHADFEVGGADLLQSGQLFRILTKPCSPSKLKSTIETGIQNYNAPEEEPEQEVHYCFCKWELVAKYCTNQIFHSFCRNRLRLLATHDLPIR